MSGPCIRTEGLTKHYGRTVGIEGLGLVVERGVVFGFLGPNGAGKTTTIRLLLDLIRPSAGRATVLGLDTRRDSVELRRRIGYLPGDLSMYDDLAGRVLLGYLASLRGGVAATRIAELAERLGVDLDRRIRTVSRGNRQKLGLIQALMHSPDLLVLDEPTAGLDPLVQQEFNTIVGEARDRGATVFLSSHILSEVQEVADLAAFVRDGRLVAVEDVDDLRRRSLRHVRVVFDRPVAAAVFERVAGVRDARAVGATFSCLLEGDADGFVKSLARHHVVSMTSEEADLEAVFLAHYRGGADADAAA